ncbi:hypothetical protein ABIE45_000728 [Methylobacterium sp. OAE515]
MIRKHTTVTPRLVLSLARCASCLSAGVILTLCLGPARAADRAGPRFDPASAHRASAFVHREHRHGRLGHGRHQPRHRIVYRAPVVGPPVGAVRIWGYLPRNHNIPMYNEPPRREPIW